jgi:hypothetical protein
MEAPTHRRQNAKTPTGDLAKVHKGGHPVPRQDTVGDAPYRKELEAGPRNSTPHANTAGQRGEQGQQQEQLPRRSYWEEGLEVTSAKIGGGEA